MTSRFHHDERDSGRLPGSQVGASMPEQHPEAQTIRAAIGRASLTDPYGNEEAREALDVLVGRLERMEKALREIAEDTSDDTWAAHKAREALGVPPQ
jgi:hypothetical protein